MMAMREIRVATMKEEEQREQEEDKTETKTAVEKGIMAWKRARASSQRTSRTTKDGETDKKKSCQKVAAKMTMRIVMVVVVKARRMIRESTPKRSRVQGDSLSRHVQFSSVITTVSVFNPENSLLLRRSVLGSQIVDYRRNILCFPPH
ncbi:unnamed protein product [Ectocarpus sp. CCAP 1310/34]|nr:unnamed protein product [Ectocarpus sp. CCAP 1310/34]